MCLKIFHVSQELDNYKAIQREVTGHQKQKIPLAKSVDASGNISDKWQGQQRQKEFPADCTGTWITHMLTTSVSCSFYMWDKAEGKRVTSYMSCLLCLYNTKRATLKQNWSKCACCFTAHINDALAEKPRHAWEEQSLQCSHRDTSSVTNARHLARQLLSWICELGVGLLL